MSSPNKKLPGKINWFNSLRRQSKSKRNPINAIDKKLQRSCFDLAGNSTFYLENNSDVIENQKNSTQEDKEQASSLVNKICSQCCCTITKSPTLITNKTVDEFENNETSKNTFTKEVKKIIYSQMPTTDGSDNHIIVNKRTEFCKTTTTTISRVVTVKRPVGIIIDENADILSKFEKSSSLDSVIQSFLNDSCKRKSNSIIQNRAASSSSILDDFNNLSYIDDCQSDTNNSELCIKCKNLIFENLKNITILSPVQQIKDELCEVVSEMESLDSQEDCKHSNKDKQMSIGRKKFNMDPKKGIEYLVDNHLLRMDAKDIALFLYKGEGLNKTAIGDYLGEKNEFNEQVLKAFVELHDFTNLILVQALRQFLWSFRLPGEAQKIDRMMECFAQRYCQLNPDIFTNTDTCYVLSFAIIMLNTSLHNPSVKEKPTVEQFISMNRGINNGGDLTRGLLESLYESIRTEPFKIPQDDGNDLMHTFFNPDKEGWLWKQGGRYKSWKRRWFILNDNCLYYFEYTTDKEPRGIIPLENISVREIQDRSKPHCFELYASGGADIIKACKTDSEGKVVEGKHTVYRMSASTDEDKQEWIKRLNQSISHNPFYDILMQRKNKASANS